MSDNELDNLFKEAAEGFKAPQDQSSWQDMANRLDQATTTSFWNWKSISTMAVVGVVSVSVILYLLTYESDIPKTKEIATNQAVEGVEGVTQEKPASNTLAETNSTSSHSEEAVVNASNSKASDTRTATATKENLNNPVSQATVGGTGNSHQSEKVNQHRNESRNPGQATTEKISSPVAVQVTGPEAQVGSSLESKSNTAQSQPPVAQKETTRGEENIQVMNDSLIKQSENEKEVKKDSALTKEEKAKPEEKRTNFIPTLGVKLAIAPDYTSVQSSTPDGLGFGYGVLLEYRFSDHWSVATGGIWTKKIYTAYDVEYSGYNADRVDGDCRMWDIPVNIYYTFTPGKSFSFYASLGLSSYLMNEENYIYYVETPSGVYDYPQQVKGENNEWFKTLNASVGMQLKLNNKLTLQFEPTLKAPLAGVGEGEVSLVSLGAFFNLRFDIPLNKP